MDSNLQNYSGGEIFEKLTNKLFSIWGINLVLKPYEIYPELQNKGIDGIIEGGELNGKTFQIKMFENTFKYKTFPREVSRYLEHDGCYVTEPHEADFHVIIDPVKNLDLGIVDVKVLLFKTREKMAGYYKGLRDNLIEEGKEPPLDGNIGKDDKYRFDAGMNRPCIKFRENEDIYQLKFRNSAYQRNVRCRRFKLLPDRITFSFVIPIIYIDYYNIDKLTKEIIKEKNPTLEYSKNVIDYIRTH